MCRGSSEVFYFYWSPCSFALPTPSTRVRTRAGRAICIQRSLMGTNEIDPNKVKRIPYRHTKQEDESWTRQSKYSDKKNILHRIRQHGIKDQDQRKRRDRKNEKELKIILHDQKDTTHHKGSGRHNRALTPDEEHEICYLLRIGFTVPRIANRFSITIGCVLRAGEKYGIPDPHPNKRHHKHD